MLMRWDWWNLCTGWGWHISCAQNIAKKCPYTFLSHVVWGHLWAPKQVYIGVDWDLYIQPAGGCLATWDRIWMRWLHDILQHSQLTKRLKALEFQTGLTAFLVTSSIWYGELEGLLGIVWVHVRKITQLSFPNFSLHSWQCDTWDRPKKHKSVNTPFSISCVPGFLMTT